MFIYRDEVYNPDSPDKGTAEIIVSKHRSGPTGTVRLAFIDTHTRFANLAEEDPSDFGEPFDASQSSSALAGGTGHSDLKHSDVGQAFEDDFF